MDFSASNRHGGATAAPPPSPSDHRSSAATSATAEDLCRLLHRLPPSLSLPSSRLKPRPPPTINFSNSQNTPNGPNGPNGLNGLNVQLGFFQLTHHGLPAQVAESAESDSLALLSLTREDKNRFSSSKAWPVGFDVDGEGESVWVDESCLAEWTRLGELAGELEKIGLGVMEGLMVKVARCGIPPRMRSLMRVSRCAGEEREYPYIVSLEYQIRKREYELLGESGWVTVRPEVGSVLVTVGDVAQVWSNGKLKKVRGKRVIEDGSSAPCVTMSLLITLPTESTVSVAPLPRIKPIQTDQDDATKEEEEEIDEEFNPFSFEDYAWRVYHERFLSRDPLDRYRRR
ncbi:hypothetical protein Scep_015534 [Stephania cephalantha]|uniref:Isopenicillin N synthase-like Fe(2+) 2OG dioxygenase domain-containing protein n=1 Tax=Stephania cephalantha TaxID=152367 RepID=A0AAP0J3E4_9MAGN